MTPSQQYRGSIETVWQYRQRQYRQYSSVEVLKLVLYSFLIDIDDAVKKRTTITGNVM